MLHRWIKGSQRILWLSGLALLALLYAACSGSGTAGTSTSTQSHSASSGSIAAPSTNQQANGAQQPASTVAIPQYLVKTLKAGMNVKDTMSVAGDMRNWISQTDPLSTSTGTDYEQAGNNLYDISLNFSVQAKFYPMVYDYLRDYAGQHGGKLTTFNESVQDVTNDYVDTTSRLRNLQAEQSRLIGLMGQAQTMGDVLSINQQLTDVEGQIEDIEGHLNSLQSQVTFYTIEISLQPIEGAPVSQPTGSWSIGQVLHDAFAASLGFGQALISVVIWLLAFCVYLIPVALIAWGGARLRGRIRHIFPSSTSVK